MIIIRLDDPNVAENFKMYDKQVEADKKEGAKNGRLYKSIKRNA